MAQGSEAPHILKLDSPKGSAGCSTIMIYCCLLSQRRVWEREEGCTGFWRGNLRERDHWGDPDADRRIILRWIFKKLEGVVRTGWSWLRIGTGGGHL